MYLDSCNQSHNPEKLSTRALKIRHSSRREETTPTVTRPRTSWRRGLVVNAWVHGLKSRAPSQLAQLSKRYSHWTNQDYGSWHELLYQGAPLLCWHYHSDKQTRVPHSVSRTQHNVISIRQWLLQSPSWTNYWSHTEWYDHLTMLI